MATQTVDCCVRQACKSVVGTAIVLMLASDGAVPSATDGLTGPCPVPNILIELPLAAAFVALFGVPSWLKMIPCPFPSPLIENSAGAEEATLKVEPATNSPVSAVRTAKRDAPTKAPQGICKAMRLE